MNLMISKPAVGTVVPMAANRLQFKGNTVSATAVGTVKRMPDTMQIRLTLHSSSTTRELASSELETDARRLTHELDALNLPTSIQRQSQFYPVQQKFRWDNGKQESDGYAGTYVLTVSERGGKHQEFPERAAAIQKVANDVGAAFDGPYYSVTKVKSAENAALRQAVRSVQRIARQMANALGFDVNNKPVHLETGANHHHAHREVMALSAAASPRGGGASAADTFQIQPQIISQSASGTFELIEREK